MTMKIFGKERVSAQPINNTNEHSAEEDTNTNCEVKHDFQIDLNQSYASDSTQMTNSKSETSSPIPSFSNPCKTKKCEKEKDKGNGHKSKSRHQKMFAIKRKIICKQVL